MKKICAVILFVAAALAAFADDNAITIQRLKHSVANTSSDAEAIEILQRLYDLAMSEQCYDDAMSAACKAATLCYRTENVEQVERWLVRSDSIPCNSTAARIDYYDIKLFSVLLCVNLGNFEHALVHAGEIDKNAASRRDKYGASIASYAKAKIYKDSGNLPMAYEEYKRSFSRQSGEYFSAAHTFDILSNVLGLIMQLERYNDAPVYLAQLKNIIGRTDFVKESDEYTDNQLKVVYQSFLLQYLSRMERKTEAQGAYSELVRLPKSSDYYENTRIARAYYDYYALNGRYEDALAVIEPEARVGHQSHEIDRIKKAEALFNLKRYDEAAELYNQIYKDLGNRYVQSLKKEYEQFSKYSDQRFDEIDAQSASADRNQIIGILVVAVVVVLLLLCAGLFLQYMHGCRLEDILSARLRKLQSQKNEIIKNKFIRQQVYDSTYNSGRAKAMFLNNMSHEIRTPLNSIKGFSEMIADFADKTEHREYARMICQNSENLIALVNSILELGRMDSGRMKFSFAEFDVVALCTESMMSCRPGEGVKAIFNPPLYPIMLNSDQGKLAMVVRILLDNACKFTKSGFVRLSILDGETYVGIIVEDSGIGIPPAKTEKVFDRFEKLDPFSPGFGLGLPIARGVVHRLGGRVYFDPTHANGAKVVVKIPKGMTQAVISELMSEGHTVVDAGAESLQSQQNPWSDSVNAKALF